MSVKFFWVPIVLFFSVSVVGAPLVTSIEIPKEKGQSVVITGSNFGEFDGEIVSWDDFDRDILGTKIDKLDPIQGNQWQALYDYRGDGIAVDNKHSVSGVNAIKLDWNIDTYSIRAFGWYGKGPYTQIYISYWRWMEGDFQAKTSNHKQFYLTGNNGGFPQLMPLIPGGEESWGIYNNVGDGNVPYAKRSNINSLNWSWGNTSSKFQRWEFFFKLNEPYTESNGIVQAWLDGAQGINANDYRTGYVDGKFVDFSLGHMTSGFSATAKAWYDDIYIATTRARVELCNKPTYSACTKKHIQFVDPLNWAPNKIVFNFHNLKAFKGEEIYIYVIDKSGNVSTGFKIPRPLPPKAN